MKPIAYAVAGLGFLLLGCQAQDQGGGQTQAQTESPAAVSGGQAIGGIAAGLIFDFTDSYSGTFPMFTVAALIGVLLILMARKPKPADGVAQATE